MIVYMATQNLPPDFSSYISQLPHQSTPRQQDISNLRSPPNMPPSNPLSDISPRANEESLMHDDVKSSQQMTEFFDRNMSQPINKLPLAVFSRIIRYVPSDDDVDAVSVIWLTHVCKYWLAVLAATNWTNIINKDEGLTILGLTRSRKKKTLEIQFNMGRNNWLSRLIQPHNQETLFLKISLVATLAHPPQPILNLRSREISLYGHDSQSESLLESFPSTLRCLSLSGIPFNQSILSIKSLTSFTLYHHKLPLHLDTLLAFLDENVSLTHVELYVSLMGPLISNRQVRNQFQHLSVRCQTAKDIQALIAYIPLPRTGDLEITCGPFGEERLGVILQQIYEMDYKDLLSPTHIRCYKQESIQLSGPNRNFRLNGPFTIKEDFKDLLSFECIQEVHLQTTGPRPSGFSCFSNTSTYPSNPLFAYPTDILFDLLSSPKAPFSLETLILQFSMFPNYLLDSVKDFVTSKCRGSKLCKVVFMFGDYILDTGKVSKQKEHMLVVESKHQIQGF